MNDSINELRNGGDDEYGRNDAASMADQEPAQQPLWEMTFRVMPDGSRDLDVVGSPSIATMMSEFNTMIENLRAQLFVDKLMAQGQNKSRIIQPPR